MARARAGGGADRAADDGAARVPDAGAPARRRAAEGRGRRDLRHRREDVREAGDRGAGDHGPRERRHDRRRPGRSSSSGTACAKATASSSSTTSPATAASGAALGEYRHCEADRLAHEPRRAPLRLHDVPRTRTTCGAASRSTCTCRGTPSLHRVPDSVSRRGGRASSRRCRTASSGRCYDGGVGFMSTVLIQGPGQQGLSQVVACRQAGAVARSSSPARRATRRGSSSRRTLGADHTIDVQAGGRARAGARAHRRRRASTSCSTAPRAPARRRCCSASTRSSAARARSLVQGELAAFPDFPIKKLTEKAITIKSARGHSYRAVELAIAQLASKRFPLTLLTTHEFGLQDVGPAIRAVGGEVEEGVVHVSLLPWKEASVVRNVRARRTAPSSTPSREYGVATVHEAQGADRSARRVHRPDLSRRAHRRHGRHRERAARRQLDDPRRGRAVPRGRRARRRADVAVRARATSASCSRPRCRRAACAAS